MADLLGKLELHGSKSMEKAVIDELLKQNMDAAREQKNVVRRAIEEVERKKQNLKKLKVELKTRITALRAIPEFGPFKENTRAEGFRLFEDYPDTLEELTTMMHEKEVLPSPLHCPWC